MVNGIEKLCPELSENLRDRHPLLLKLCVRAMMLHQPNRVYEEARRLLINVRQLSSQVFVHRYIAFQHPAASRHFLMHLWNRLPKSELLN